MGALEENTTLIYGIHIRESANDGSDFSNAASDYRVLFLGEDGYLHVKNSGGTVTSPYDVSGSLPAYSSFTPALSALTTPPTLGSGSAVAGTYVQLGKLVQGYGNIVFGSSGTNAGSGTYTVSLPVNVDFATGTPGSQVIGQFYTFDGSSTERTGLLRVAGGTPGVAFMTWPASASNSNVGSASPHAWGTGDTITYQFCYKGV